MKFLLVLVACIASASAGARFATPEIEIQALRLWQQFCTNPEARGQLGDMDIYCKIAPEDVNENIQHPEVTLRPAAGRDRVVFVQPPSYNYNHEITVSGGGGTAGKTTIFVKPPKNTHKVNVDDKTVPSLEAQKPALYFLRGKHEDKPLYPVPYPQPQPLPQFNQ